VWSRGIRVVSWREVGKGESYHAEGTEEPYQAAGGTEASCLA
jgi:hypothetical protein